MTNAELAQLYESYSYLVLRRCQRLLGLNADAEDALQEVFLKARAKLKPNTERSPLFWLYRVATHCCYDLLRRRALTNRLRPAVEITARTADDGADADRRALMGMVLRKVDEPTCELGLLHHLDGLTQDELSAVSGYSRKTVGKKLQIFEREFKQLWNTAGGSE